MFQGFEGNLEWEISLSRVATNLNQKGKNLNEMRDNFHDFSSFFWGDIRARMSVRIQEKIKVRSSIKKTLLPRDLAKIGFKIKGSKTTRKTIKLGKSNPNI